MPEELNIKQLTKEAENGEPCNLMRALDDVDFSGKVKILNDVVQNNKSNRSTDPSLPEISISKTASKDEQGVPVAELALKVPGVLDYESNLHLSTGSAVGVSTVNKQCGFGGIIKEPRSFEEYKKEQERFKNAVREMENSNPCKFMEALDKMNFQNTIGALNRALVINKDDRSSLPLLRLPEFSVEKSISMDANGVPVAEASLKVPGILSYKAELALSSGNESGVAYTKKQCLLPLVETNPSIKAPSQERSASGCASDGGWKDWGHEERGGLHKRDSDDVWKDWGHEERGGLVNRDSNDAWKDWGHEERGGLGN